MGREGKGYLKVDIKGKTIKERNVQDTGILVLLECMCISLLTLP